jgi:uncharacterized protein YukE
MESEKLKEIRNNLSMLPVLQERSEKLDSRINEAEDDVWSLLRKFEEESLDVEQLKKESFSTTFLKLVGKYEGKLDKESQEVLAAKIEYDKASERIKELYSDRDELMNRISALKAEQQTYENELKSREEIILGVLNSEISAQYKKLGAEEEMLSKQLIETEEALNAAHRVKNTAQSAMQHLDSAEGWATYDVWFKGGIFSYVAKYDHIDEAQSDFNKLHSQMRDLQKELSDIDALDIPVVCGIDSTTRSIDFWFDNIFTDLSVREQIRDDIEQIRVIFGEIDGIISRIERKKAEIHKALENIGQRKNELIISL